MAAITSFNIINQTGYSSGHHDIKHSGRLCIRLALCGNLIVFNTVYFTISLRVTSTAQWQRCGCSTPSETSVIGHETVLSLSWRSLSLRWRHNGRDSISNHQPHDCLLNRLFRRRSKKISKLRVTGLCAGNSPGTGEFPAQMASNAENVSIWWRHHDTGKNVSLY